MRIYELVGILLPNIVMNYILFDFFNQVYGKKYSKRIYGIIYLCSVAIQSFVTFCKVPFLSLVTFCIIVVFLASMGYKGLTRGKVVYTFIYVIYIVFLDIIIVPISAGITNTTMDQVLKEDLKYFITGVVSCIVAISTYKMVIQCVTKHKIKVLSRSQEIFVILLGLFELVTIHKILKVKDYSLPESNGITVFIFIGYIVLDLYIVYLFEWISQTNELKMKAFLLEQKQMMDNHYYKELEYKNLEYQKVMHDFNKHINVIRQMNSVDDNYCRDITDVINSNNNRFQCRNQVLNIIVNNTIQLCESKKIDYKLQIEDIDLSFMSKMDITTIFLNLINNAIEENIELEEHIRKINVSIRQRQYYIIVKITNPCRTIQSDYHNSVSQKEGHMGLGLENVRTVLEKYNAELCIINSEKEFRVQFIIQSPTFFNGSYSE